MMGVIMTPSQCKVDAPPHPPVPQWIALDGAEAWWDNL